MKPEGNDPRSRLEVAVCLLLAVLAAAPAEGGVDLVRDGTARAVVITADDPAPVAKHAANELIDHIELATGVRLDLMTESAIHDPSKNQVYIGDTRAARAAGIAVDALTDEAAVLRATDRALYIVGRENSADPLDQNNRRSGTLWGVYESHPNITLGFVPWQGWANWMPPRSETEQQWLMDQWDRWVATGATLYYRPNSLLDGYAMPYVYTRELAALFQHFAANGMIGTDYSRLTGQWAVQGPTLYVLARLHTRPFDDLDTLLAEYYHS